MVGVDSRELQPSTPEVELPGVSSPSSWGVVESGLRGLYRWPRDSTEMATCCGLRDKAQVTAPVHQTHLKLVLFPESGEWGLI